MLNINIQFIRLEYQISDTRKGKSGGYRIIYYTITSEAILLTTIYSKLDRKTISNKEVEDIIGQYELEIEQRDTEIFDTDSEDSDPLI